MTRPLYILATLTVDRIDPRLIGLFSCSSGSLAMNTLSHKKYLGTCQSIKHVPLSFGCYARFCIMEHGAHSETDPRRVHCTTFHNCHLPLC